MSRGSEKERRHGRRRSTRRTGNRVREGVSHNLDSTGAGGHPTALRPLRRLFGNHPVGDELPVGRRNNRLSAQWCELVFDPFGPPGQFEPQHAMSDQSAMDGGKLITGDLGHGWQSGDPPLLGLLLYLPVRLEDEVPFGMGIEGVEIVVGHASKYRHRRRPIETAPCRSVSLRGRRSAISGTPGTGGKLCAGGRVERVGLCGAGSSGVGKGLRQGCGASRRDRFLGDGGVPSGGPGASLDGGALAWWGRLSDDRGSRWQGDLPSTPCCESLSC